MFDLPDDAPADLEWFGLWAGLGLALLALNKVFDRDEVRLREELGEKSGRGLDKLNHFLVKQFSASGQVYPSPIDEDALEEAHALVREAWVPKSNLRLLLGVSRLVRVFGVLQVATAVPAAGIWWAFEELRDPATWLVAGVLLTAGPAFVMLLLEIVGMFLWTVKKT